jgi:TRAP-type mannitol/chloroaromatic compound transport system substrate-binding protein
MDRRQFVTGASVGVAGAVSVYPKPAIAQGARELKMVTIWPKGSPGLQSGADRSRNRSPAVGRTPASQGVPRRPAGRCHGIVRCRLFGPRRLYHASEVTWAGQSATFAYFCNVPFGFTPDEINAWVYYGGGQALWDELSAGFGLKPFLCGNTGPQSPKFTPGLGFGTATTGG